MPAIIIALSRFCRAVQTFLHRGLYEFFVLFQIKYRPLSDTCQIGVPAMGAGITRQNLASDGKIDVLHAAHELFAPFQIFLFKLCGQRLLRRIGLLCPCPGKATINVTATATSEMLFFMMSPRNPLDI